MYNGYKNYATWSLFNFLSNNEESYNHYQRIYSDLTATNDTETAIEELAEIFRADFKATDIIDMNASTKHGLYKDILEDALEQVDFREVASSFVE